MSLDVVLSLSFLRQCVQDVCKHSTCLPTSSYVVLWVVVGAWFIAMWCAPTVVENAPPHLQQMFIPGFLTLFLKEVVRTPVSLSVCCSNPQGMWGMCRGL